VHQLALLGREAGAEALPDGVDVGPLAVRADALGDLRLDVPRSQHDQADDGRSRDRRRDKREEA
jgi:hypothetical protein